MPPTPSSASIVHDRQTTEDRIVDTYLRSHLVSNRIADAHATAARHRLVRRASSPAAARNESLVARVAGALRVRPPHQALTPRVDPR